MTLTVALLLSLACLGLRDAWAASPWQPALSTSDFGAWRSGRATHYGTDAWSIHSGSCGYGNLDPAEPLGWNVAAMADSSPYYGAPACGLCLEVKCQANSFKDNYGQFLDRRSVCYGEGSVVVRVTDTCPCTYKANEYSNKRWCCGDMEHLDLSYVAFRRLAKLEWGVIGISYRPVPCNYAPPVVAQDYEGAPRSTATTVPLRAWPEYQGSKPSPLTVFSDSFENGFYDASWGASVEVMDAGVARSKALCASVQPGGALSLATRYSSAFQGRTSIGFWMYVGTAGDNGELARVADITVSVSGTQGACLRPRIWAVHPTQYLPSCTYCTDYWWYFEFSLAGFVYGGSPTTPLRVGGFNGCGFNSLSAVNRIEFRNDGYGGNNNKYVCLDNVVLY